MTIQEQDDLQQQREHRAFTLLNHCVNALAQATTKDSLLHETCQILVEEGSYALAWISFIPEHDTRQCCLIHHTTYRRDTLHITSLMCINGHCETEHPYYHTLRTGKPYVVANAQSNPLCNMCLSQETKFDHASIIILPLNINGNTIGILTILADQLNAFDNHEIRLLTSIANTLAYGINALHKHTEHQQMENSLKESEHRLRKVIEHVADPIMVVQEGVICFVNLAAESLFGCTTKDLIGLEIGTTISKKAELEIRNTSGKQTIEEMNVTEIEWDGKPASLISLRDITAHKQVEEELTQRISERTRLLEYTTEQLTIELANRDKIEQTLIRRDIILESIGFAAEQFMDSPKFYETIQNVLARLGYATGMKRVYITKCEEHASPDQIEEYPLYQWVAHHQETVFAKQEYTLCKDLFTQWKEVLRQGQPVYSNHSTFSEQERIILESQCISSIAIFPIFVDRTWWGILGFEDDYHSHNWLPAEVDTLKIAANLIGAAIYRNLVQEKLQKSEERFRLLAEHAQDIIYRYCLFPSLHYEYISPSVEAIMGYTPEEYYEDPYIHLQSYSPDVRPLFNVELFDAPLTLNFTRKDGKEIWLEQLDRLFQTFSQVHTSLDHKHEGSGLGLIISKRLAECMGGTIWAENNQDRGATFHVKIQVEPVAIQQEQRISTSHQLLKPAFQSSDSTLAHKKVLIVEHNATNTHILTHQVKQWGMIPTVVSIADHVLSLIWQVVRFLIKPIRPAILYEALAKIFCRSSDTFPKSLLEHVDLYATKERRISPDNIAHHHPICILLAEDNVVNQQVALGMLKKLGYYADTVATGKEALHAALQEDREWLLESGMDDYISKPIELERLKTALLQGTQRKGKPSKKQQNISEIRHIHQERPNIQQFSPLLGSNR